MSERDKSAVVNVLLISFAQRARYQSLISEEIKFYL